MMNTVPVNFVRKNYKEITFWLLVSALAVWVFGGMTKP